MKLRALLENFSFENENLLVEKQMSPVQKAEGDNWIRDNPVHYRNVVEHWRQATPDERRHGMNWYKDAHSMAKLIARDTSTPMHVMAGLISNYSPQTHWHTNILTAARVAHDKIAVGGPGSGVMASAKQRDMAHRMLQGEHYDSILKGHKVRAFAHLIEHGGDKDAHDPKVVVDRHAFAVASGSRVPDNAYVQAGLNHKKAYNNVVQAYHHASRHILEHHGEHVAPHQLQAITWLVRQRLNAQEEVSGRGSSKTSKIGAVAKRKWTEYASERHPNVVGMEPGTGYNLKKVKRKK